MLEPIVNAGMIISLFAIAAPFIFVLLVIKIVTGGKKKGKRKQQKDDDNAETVNEMSRGIRDLKKRIDNLETLKTRNKDKEQ